MQCEQRGGVINGQIVKDLKEASGVCLEASR